jgi:hypothetical protein
VSETGTNTDFVLCWVGDFSAVPGCGEEIGRFYPRAVPSTRYAAISAIPFHYDVFKQARRRL